MTVFGCSAVLRVAKKTWFQILRHQSLRTDCHLHASGSQVLLQLTELLIPCLSIGWFAMLHMELDHMPQAMDQASKGASCF